MRKLISILIILTATSIFAAAKTPELMSEKANQNSYGDDSAPQKGSQKPIDKRKIGTSADAGMAFNEAKEGTQGRLAKLKSFFTFGADNVDSIDSSQPQIGRRDFLKKAAILTGGTFAANTMLGSSLSKLGTNKEGAEVTNGPGDYKFLPEVLPYGDLTQERSEALQKKRIMYVPILITENAKADIEAGGGNLQDAVKKNTDSLEEFMKNCGGDLKCEIQATVIVIPNDKYADSESQDGATATTFLNTNLTSGSWLDEELKTLADAQGVPRDKMYPYMFARNMKSFAQTNFSGPGVVMHATDATHPTLHDKIQKETGPHELAKQYGFENDNSAWEYDVPTDAEGNLLYDFRIGEWDAPVKKLVSPTYTMKPGEYMQETLFLPKVHSGPNGKVQLYDQKSGTMIELPYGDEDHDAWHSATWERLDEFTHERVGDTEPPQFETTSFSHTGMLDGIEGIALSFSMNEAVSRGTGSIQVVQEDGTVVHTFTDEEITIDDAGKVTFAALDLPSETKMKVKFAEGAFKDASDNLSPVNESWSLETPDVTAPQFETGTFSPAGVLSGNENIALSFSMNGAVTRGTGSIQIVQEDGTVVHTFTDDEITIDAAGKVTFAALDLPAETTMKVKFAEGAFKDASGNLSPVNESWSLETPDITAPQFETDGFSPSATLEVLSGVVLSMKFTEPVKKGSGTMEILKEDGTLFSGFDAANAIFDETGKIVSFPAIDFESETKFYVHIPEGFVVDQSSNENKSPAITDKTTWDFETPDVTAPQLKENGLSPFGQMEEAKTEFPLSMEFETTDLVLGNGSVRVYNKSTGAEFTSFSAGQLTIDGNKISVTVSNVPALTEFYVLVDEGAVTDAEGNEFEITDTGKWVFKTDNQVGIEETEEQKESVIVYEAGGGQWMIKIKNDSYDPVDVSITNILGQQTRPIVQQSLSGTTNITEYLPDAAGLYIIQVTIGDKPPLTRKIIKSR
jgi:hypothetical protein